MIVVVREVVCIALAGLREGTRKGCWDGDRGRARSSITPGTLRYTGTKFLTSCNCLALLSTK